MDCCDLRLLFVIQARLEMNPNPCSPPPKILEKIILIVFTSNISIRHTHAQVALHDLLNPLYLGSTKSSIDHEVLTALVYVLMLMFASEN